jgi:hypothetical protein
LKLHKDKLQSYPETNKKGVIVWKFNRPIRGLGRDKRIMNPDGSKRYVVHLPAIQLYAEILPDFEK